MQYAHWKCVPPWCPTQSQAADLQTGHSEPLVHPNKVTQPWWQVDHRWKLWFARPDPKRFCGDCNSLVACTSSKASATAWHSDIWTHELNNSSGTSSAVRYQRCRLNAWVADWEILLSASSYCSSRLKSCGWCISSLLTRKPPHAIRMSNNVANSRSYGTWWRLGIVPGGSCPMSTTGDSECNFQTIHIGPRCFPYCLV